MREKPRLSTQTILLSPEVSVFAVSGLSARVGLFVEVCCGFASGQAVLIIQNNNLIIYFIYLVDIISCCYLSFWIYLLIFCLANRK